MTGSHLKCLFVILKDNEMLFFLFVFFPPELQVGTRQKELLDIDSSSVILEDGITKLNTIGHYEVRARPSPHVPVLVPSPHCTLRILQHHVSPLRKLQDSQPFSRIVCRLSLGPFSLVAHLEGLVNDCPSWSAGSSRPLSLKALIFMGADCSPSCS